MAAGWRPGITRGRGPRRTIFGGAVKAQQFSATFKDRHTRVAGRVRGAMGKEKGLLKILSSMPGMTEMNHDVFTSNPVMSEDVRQVLQQGRQRGPSQRLLVLHCHQGPSGSHSWVYDAAAQARSDCAPWPQGRRAGSGRPGFRCGTTAGRRLAPSRPMRRPTDDHGPRRDPVELRPAARLINAKSPLRAVGPR